jgi:predicted transcriptional regulator
MSKTVIYTVQEAAKLTGRSENALRKRMDRGSLKFIRQRIGSGRMVRAIPDYELAKAGLLKASPTQTDEGIARLIEYLRQRPNIPLQTHSLKSQSGLSRQPAEIALATLRALGHVEKTNEPPPDGTGRPRVVWRWTGRP